MKTRIGILVLLMAAISSSQEESGRMVRKGQEAFYQAEFEQAHAIMRQVLRDSAAAAHDRFDAHLFSAFSLIRQNADQDSIRSHFQQAVLIDPARELDANLIPPDLYDQYVLVRQAAMGGVTILSKPAQAVAICYDPRAGKSISMNTPAAFLNLYAGEYEIVLHALGHRDLQTMIKVLPGRTDSLFFQLSQLPKPWYKKWWAWGGGGACAALAFFALQDSGDKASAKGNELPLPPARP
jgi:hypothetical protein